jgi:hypothetical protein
MSRRKAKADTSTAPGASFSGPVALELDTTPGASFASDAEDATGEAPAQECAADALPDEPAESPAPAAADPLPPTDERPRRGTPCVGRPVQYHRDRGDGRIETLAATLARESLTSPGHWDIVAVLPSGRTFIRRSGVRHAETPEPGTWTFLPE